MHKIAILASGSGSNAENIVKYFQGCETVRVAVVLSNRSDAKVHDRMNRLGVESLTLGNEVWATRPSEVISVLQERDIELVVLAGFLRKIHPDIVSAYSKRIINIHPSLLPAYGGKGMYGHRIHEAVIAAGERESGVTIHFVSNEMDKGEVIMQERIAISEHETPDSLEMKIHLLEYKLYPQAISTILGINRSV